ncbi:MAG TPA: FliM/FliN family flagellar motor C-terminal domain-containing protein, partial [Ramlibacter sp.]
PDLSPWSGSVLVSLPGGARVLLGAALVRILVAWADDAGASQAAWSAPTPRVPVDRALAGIALNLQVHLEGCELSVGSLQDLQIGDVLRLQHRVDAPAAVTLPDGAPLFNGFLARTRGRKAVELAPAVA